VQSLDESITDEEAIAVLGAIEDNHDAEQGINWDVIQYHIDDLKQGRDK
jgi:hypothetical protein